MEQQEQQQLQQQQIQTRSVISKLIRINAQTQNFGEEVQPKTVLEEILKNKFIIFGEVHEKDIVISFQHEIADFIIKNTNKKLSIVMEHFSLEMQDLLNLYKNSQISFEELEKKYKEIGTESFNIVKYKQIIDLSKQYSDRVSINGGFIPRTYAKLMMSQGLEKALEAAKEKNYIMQDEQCNGSDEHYNFFESLISRRNMHNPAQKSADNFRKIFPAQIIKDCSMALKIHSLLNDSDYILAITGIGHMGYNYGIPERVYKLTPSIQNQTFRIFTHDYKYNFENLTVQDYHDIFGTTTNCADVTFIFKEQTEDELREQTVTAYNKVGDTAYMQGNLKKAIKKMAYIGYSPEEIKTAGQDAYNYQGIGNPHKFIEILKGQTILDLGSGLGVDSFIAAERVGPEGQVIGIDIAKTEIKYATERAQIRSLKNVKFIEADMEKLPFEENYIDNVISNGAFCLAPNKKKAFEEIFRVLKPGGRISVCTSTIIKNLQAGVNWPICMRMFIHIDELKPMCESIGFQNVVIDTSNSLMQYTIEEDEEEKKQQEQQQNNQNQNEQQQKQQQTSQQTNEHSIQRNKVHIGSDEFKHLKDYNMNEICARVVVLGNKPFKQ